MKLEVNKELIHIARTIEMKKLSVKEWSEIESDDMYQTESYSGGFDADECAFCFSYYTGDDKEYWFDFTLDDIPKILSGDIKQLELRKPEI